MVTKEKKQEAKNMMEAGYIAFVIVIFGMFVLAITAGLERKDR